MSYSDEELATIEVFKKAMKLLEKLPKKERIRVISALASFYYEKPKATWLSKQVKGESK